MKQDLGPLGSADFLTQQELHDSLGHHFSAQVREWYRGVDYLGFYGAGPATLVTVPGPDSGYVWSIKLASAQLSAAGALSVYPGDATNVAPFGTATAIAQGTQFEAMFTWTSNVVVLKDQRNLTLWAGGTTTINSWRVLVKQVPAEMQAKL
jgi:hypothetical protein